MAINNNNLLLLLVFVIGMSLIGGIVEAQEKRCQPANYMTCPTTGILRLIPSCNCDFTPEGGCTFNLASGRTMQCPDEGKACPRNLIPAKFMTCSFTGDIQLRPA
ncbi:hypothetical protein P5E73_16500, partial [Clostridium perfringens]|nr:hypothetical protein [Clostridium perfringens]